VRKNAVEQELKYRETPAHIFQKIQLCWKLNLQTYAVTAAVRFDILLEI
jgi:hypothetical protein